MLFFCINTFVILELVKCTLKFLFSIKLIILQFLHIGPKMRMFFIIINKNDLEDGVWVIEAMRKLALIQSNGEGRRLIANGGVRVNDTVINDPEKQLNVSDISISGMIKLSAGKKRHALVKLQ